MPHHSCGSPRAVAEPCTAANLLILQLSPATGRTRWEFSAPENNYSVGSSWCHKNLDVVNERHEHLDIRDSAAKGLGVFSRRSIAAGECIIAELPLVSVCGPDLDPSCCRLDQIVSNLCDADQRDLYALCSRGDEGHNALCIWKSNAYPTPCDGDAGRASVFRLCCRINHECCPNAHIAWNGRLGRQTVYALRDIAKDEEITVACKPPAFTPVHAPHMLHSCCIYMLHTYTAGSLHLFARASV